MKKMSEYAMNYVGVSIKLVKFIIGYHNLLFLQFKMNVTACT